MVSVSVSLDVQVSLMVFAPFLAARSCPEFDSVRPYSPAGTGGRCRPRQVNRKPLPFFPKAAGVDVMNTFKAPGAVISPGVSEICRPSISLVKSFNHLFDDFKIGRTVPVINFQNQLLCQRPKIIQVMVIFFVLVFIRLFCQCQSQSDNLFDNEFDVMPVEKQHRINQKILVPSRRIDMTNENVSSPPVTFGVRCAVIRHVIQTCVIVPVTVACQ